MVYYKMSFWQIFVAGGPIMWPILLCSIFAVAIFFEKIFYLNKTTVDVQVFLGKILEKIKVWMLEKRKMVKYHIIFLLITI